MQVVFGAAAVFAFVRFLVARDRRIAHEDYAPYYRWLRTGKEE